MFQFNDGGRADAGYKGRTGDCVVRAIAIASGLPYRQVYDAINDIAAKERPTRAGKRSSSRLGVFKKTYHDYILGLGFRWAACMQIGSGCQVHVRADELPAGRLILRLSRHLAAFIDGVLHDTEDCGRDGARCVYGYYVKT